MSECFTAHGSTLETTARFPSNSQERESFTTETVLQIQTKRTDSVRTIPNRQGFKLRLDSGSQCNSSTVFDLVVQENHARQRCTGLVVFAAKRRVPNTQSGSL